MKQTAWGAVGGPAPRAGAGVSGAARGIPVPRVPTQKRMGRVGVPPYCWGEPNTVSKCRALQRVSGPETGFNKYFLLLVKDVFIQSILLLEQIVCG